MLQTSQNAAGEMSSLRQDLDEALQLIAALTTRLNCYENTSASFEITTVGVLVVTVTDCNGSIIQQQSLGSVIGEFQVFEGRASCSESIINLLLCKMVIKNLCTIPLTVFSFPSIFF